MNNYRAIKSVQLEVEVLKSMEICWVEKCFNMHTTKHEKLLILGTQSLRKNCWKFSIFALLCNFHFIESFKFNGRLLASFFSPTVVVLITKCCKLSWSSNTPCGQEELMLCSQRLKPFTDSSGFNFINNKKDLDIICPWVVLSAVFRYCDLFSM